MNTPSKPDTPAKPDTDPDLQGEGNYTAARRHRESTEKFIESGKVEPAARDAAPENPDEAREMKDAEEKGRERARK